MKSPNDLTIRVAVTLDDNSESDLVLSQKSNNPSFVG